jgi:hypothetical protein
MTKTTTSIYHKDEFVRSEGLVKFSDWIKNGRVEVGQSISLSDVDFDEGSMINHEKLLYTIVVGNCTPYHQPTDNDAGIGWDFDDPMMEKYVTEVNTF